MRKVFKIAGIFFGIVAVVIVAGLIYFNSTYPKVDPPSKEKVERTKERIARGEYLANHVTVCMDCHSKRDWTKFSGPIVPGSEGRGGDMFGKEIGIPGTIYAKNITPAGIGHWSDGEILRAITCGVTRDNQALFPIMPYAGYNNLTKEDAQAIVSYLRSIEPRKNNVPERSLDFPMNLIVKMIPPQSYKPKVMPDKNDKPSYGKYLVTIAACADCHSQSKEGEPVKGKEFAGGNEFVTPLGTVRTANITPDETTGIGSWTKADFIKKFKSVATDSAKNISVAPGEFNSVMPWTMYGGMSEEDLGSIYEYLRTVPAVKNRVNRFTPPQNKQLSAN